MSGKFFDYSAGSRSFLNRAKERLAAYDEGAYVSDLLYAALELRMGIETRLYEYLAPVCQSRGTSVERLKEYSATRLLRKLVELDPDAHDAESSPEAVEARLPSTLFEYTPVSSRLARMHGQLGDMLHARFFVTNRHWNLRASMLSRGSKSMVDCREFLSEVVAELETATDGGLLVSPKFFEKTCGFWDAPRENDEDGRASGSD